MQEIEQPCRSTSGRASSRRNQTLYPRYPTPAVPYLAIFHILKLLTQGSNAFWNAPWFCQNRNSHGKYHRNHRLAEFPLKVTPSGISMPPRGIRMADYRVSLGFRLYKRALLPVNESYRQIGFATSFKVKREPGRQDWDVFTEERTP